MPPPSKAIEHDKRQAAGKTVMNSKPMDAAETPGRIRIAVIDDHPLFRESVIETLAGAGPFEIVGEGATAGDAIRVAREIAPDVMLLDLRMPGGGVQAAASIAGACPAVRIIMFTASESEHDVIAALRAGAQGYILKNSSGLELVETVRDIARGNSYVAPNLAARLLINQGKAIETAVVDSTRSLTPYEEKIFALVSRGMSNKEIARQLNCTERTIKHHMTNIMRKLNVRNRVEAALKFTGVDGRTRLQ